MNDDLLFADDDDEALSEPLGSWKILIVDDEPEVHAVTKLALSDFELNGKTLEFISAYNGEEAKQCFRDHTDIAVVLLDVVMETDDAGLKVADYVRNDLDNHFTRIILRTGQPGQAPEKEVIINYDINDYKSKTELTAQKLFTVIIAALRSYRDIMVIEENRAGLEKILDASVDLFSSRSLEKFMQGIIQQLSSILGCSKDAAYITTAVAVPRPINNSNPEELYVFAGNGEYANKEGIPLKEAVSQEEYELCKQALKNEEIVYAEDHVVAYCNSESRKGSLLYLSGLPRRIGESDKHLVTRFSNSVQLAFDNVLKTSEVEATQREIIERLGGLIDASQGSNRHIQRMVEMADFIASKLGIDDERKRQLRLAIPLHNIGNSKIPQSLTSKRDAINEAQKFEIMKHAEFGYQILKDSEQPTIRLAAMLARQHHEHWDGSGYPEGVKEQAISIESRITALVDAVDVLLSESQHQQDYDVEKVLTALREKRATQFDPALVDLIESSIHELATLHKKYND